MPTVGDLYLEQHPHLRKWVNVCIGCNAQGYKPELPSEITGTLSGKRVPTPFAARLRLYFKPLPVNENGLCELCQKFNNPWHTNSRES
jgi:hypothetical protein